MSKKTFIIIISVVLILLLVGLVGYYLIIQNNSSTSSGPGGIFKNFFPFGGGSPTPTSAVEENPTATSTPAVTNYTQKLRELSSEPVAGAGVLDVKAGTVVRHIEKATGHIFETELFSPNQYHRMQLLMTTLYPSFV